MGAWNKGLVVHLILKILKKKGSQLASLLFLFILDYEQQHPNTLTPFSPLTPLAP